MSGALLAAVPPGSDYFSVVKILLLAAVLPAWLYAASWVNKDAKHVHANQMVWSVTALAAGLLSLLMWLLLPWYFAGLGIYVVLVGGFIGGYVSYRNKRVLPEARVLTAEHLHSVFARERREGVGLVQKVKVYDHIRRFVTPPMEDQVGDRKAYNLVQGFLYNLITFRASDADITPTGEQAAVRFVIDGVIHNQPTASLAEAEMLINYVKQISGINLEEKRRPQQGKFAVDAGAVKVDVDVTTSGTMHGQRVQVKIVQEATKINLDELGLTDDIKTKLLELNGADDGIVIVAGPRRNGVTSTAYSLLRKHDSFMHQLLTLESPVIVDMENVTQVAYKDQAELAPKLAQSLRRDPDVVLVDKCETVEAASLLIEAAAAKNVLLGMTAGDSFIALAKWVKLAGNDKEDGLRLLKGILCQMLLRKLCPNCREGYTPAREVLAKLNLPAKIDKFYRAPTKPLVDEKGNPVTCPTCQGTGYLGRTAAFELLEMTDEIRQMVVAETPLAKIKAACRKNKMLYLQEQGLRKVIEGVTSVEEVIRVTRAKSQES